MKDTLKKPKTLSHTQAEKMAVFSFLAALALWGISSWLALIPLLFFLLLCFIAPFCPQWGFFLPIISRSITSNKGIVLTLDDGPSPVTTPILLQLLKEHNYKATFFVIGQRAQQYPELITDIILITIVFYVLIVLLRKLFSS